MLELPEIIHTGKTAEFGGMTFTLDDTETSNDGYYQLYVEVKADSDGEYSHSVADATRKMPLFIYVGDNADSENLASENLECASNRCKGWSLHSTNCTTNSHTY